MQVKSLCRWGGSCGLDIATLAAAGRTQKPSTSTIVHKLLRHTGPAVSEYTLAHNNSRTDASRSLVFSLHVLNVELSICLDAG